MILKEWSGKLVIDSVEVEVRAFMDELNRWYGFGYATSLDDLLLLNSSLKRGHSYITKIGELYIVRISISDNTFSFEGTGFPLF